MQRNAQPSLCAAAAGNSSWSPRVTTHVLCADFGKHTYIHVRTMSETNMSMAGAHGVDARVWHKRLYMNTHKDSPGVTDPQKLTAPGLWPMAPGP